MELADRLRETADRLPAAPLGNPAATFRRGRRRRQRRQGGIAAAAAAGVIAIATVGLPLLDAGGPDDLEVADQPPAAVEPVPDAVPGEPDRMPGAFEWTDIVGPPAAIVSSTEPFHWAVAVSPGEDDRWCATTSRGSTFLGDATGQPCDQLIAPDPDDPRGFGSGASEVQGNPDGTPAEGMSWGLAPANADEVTVLLTDGTRVQAELADEATGNGRLWAVGYLDTEVVAVEASADGTVLGARIPSAAVPASGPVATPQDAFGDRLEPEQLDRVGDEARAMFDLRADDELYALQLPADRALGIRVRDEFAPLMWATDCDLLSSEPLPDGWIGLCLEYTHPEAGRVSGLFPHGTTSGTTDATNP